MGIRLKLFLPTILAFGILVGAIHFYWLPLLIEHERTTIIKWESGVLRAIGPGLVQPLLVDDLGVIYSTLNRQMEINTGGWKQLILKNAKGKQLYPITKPEELTSDTLLRIEREIQWEGNVLAVLHLRVDWEQERLLQLRRIHRMEILAVVIFALVIVITGVWQNRWIRIPLVRLAKAADHLAKGDYKTQLPDVHRDELGSLTVAFARMRSDLQDSHRELNKTILLANESEARQRMLLENMVDGFITTNEHGVIVSFNPAAERIFEYRSDEVLGCNVSMLMPETESRGHDAYLARYKKTGDASVIGVGREIEGRRKDGSLFPIDVALSDTEIGGKRIFSAVIRDISERIIAQQQLREQKEHLSTILENTNDAYLTVDKDWRVTFANQVSMPLLDVNPQEVIGVDLRDALPDIVSMFYKMLRSTLVHQVAEESMVLYGPTMKYLQAYSLPTKEGLIVHFHDVTLRKKIRR